MYIQYSSLHYSDVHSCTRTYILNYIHICTLYVGNGKTCYVCTYVHVHEDYINVHNVSDVGWMVDKYVHMCIHVALFMFGGHMLWCVFGGNLAADILEGCKLHSLFVLDAVGIHKIFVLNSVYCQDNCNSIC